MLIENKGVVCSASKDHFVKFWKVDGLETKTRGETDWKEKTSEQKKGEWRNDKEDTTVHYILNDDDPLSGEISKLKITAKPSTVTQPLVTPSQFEKEKNGVTAAEPKKLRKQSEDDELVGWSG